MSKINFYSCLSIQLHIADVSKSPDMWPNKCSLRASVHRHIIRAHIDQLSRLTSCPKAVKQYSKWCLLCMFSNWALKMDLSLSLTPEDAKSRQQSQVWYVANVIRTADRQNNVGAGCCCCCVHSLLSPSDKTLKQTWLQQANTKAQ